jgi:acyl carrier protein
MKHDEILNQLATIIRNTLNCGSVPITNKTTAMDVRGWDSLSHTLVLMSIEDGFKIRLPLERVLGVNNVGDLANVISELLPNEAPVK